MSVQRGSHAAARLAQDAYLVQTAIRDQPGLASKNAIANHTGLSVHRVATVIRRNEEVGFVLLAYGKARALSGPNAGVEVTGWFAMHCGAYYDVMDQHDLHMAKTEAGMSRGRLQRALDDRGGAAP